jgi:hypothetical protein
MLASWHGVAVCSVLVWLGHYAEAGPADRPKPGLPVNLTGSVRDAAAAAGRPGPGRETDSHNYVRRGATNKTATPERSSPRS